MPVEEEEEEEDDDDDDNDDDDEPTGCTVYFLPTASQHKPMTYTNCCIYRAVPPDDEQ
jgi:hypothetical protein